MTRTEYLNLCTTELYASHESEHGLNPEKINSRVSWLLSALRVNVNMLSSDMFKDAESCYQADDRIEAKRADMPFVRNGR